MSDQKNAIFSGLWPIEAGKYDPALDGAGIPDGAAVFALVDQNYTKFGAPESIDGLRQVVSVAELDKDCYCVIKASSGFEYVVLMSEGAEKMEIAMRELPLVEGNISVIKTYRQSIPATRFIGKKYGDEDRVDGGFGTQWEQWLQNDWFTPIKSSPGFRKGYFEDSDAYIGFMRFKEGAPFEYWVGLFAAPETVVPEGYEAIDLPEKKLGVCWLYGPEDEIYGKDGLVMSAFSKAGIEAKPDADGTWYFAERYADRRFSKSETDNNIILDHFYFLNG